jgi:hypothetical protein
MFTSFDYRLPNDPKSLQSSSNEILFKTFFNILRIIDPELINNNYKKVPFVGLISDLIQCNNPDKDFLQLFRNYLPPDKSIQKVEFIRRSAILESLLFNTFTISNEFDFQVFWQYQISPIEHIQLNKFTFISLPKLFPDLARQPYNCPLDTYTKNLAICLFTGVIVNYSMANYDSDYPPIDLYVKNNGFIGIVHFIIICGKDISKAFVFIISNYEICLFPSI